MKKVVLLGGELNVEERNLLSVAYKNSVGTRRYLKSFSAFQYNFTFYLKIILNRTAWRSLSSIEQKEESKGSKNLKLLKEYKKKIEGELNNFCEDILKLIENTILTSCSNADSKVFFLKMQGDYYR
jgi:14-3-3 protein epsilon